MTGSAAVSKDGRTLGASALALRDATLRVAPQGEAHRQFFSWIIRSTERRALAAISGSITTSSFMYTRLSRIFGSVMRFMCGQRLHGFTNSTSGNSAFTLSAIEHSVTITTRLGLFLRTQSIMPFVEPV